MAVAEQMSDVVPASGGQTGDKVPNDVMNPRNVVFDEQTCDQVPTGAVQLVDEQTCAHVPTGAVQQVDEQACNKVPNDVMESRSVVATEQMSDLVPDLMSQRSVAVADQTSGMVPNGTIQQVDEQISDTVIPMM